MPRDASKTRDRILSAAYGLFYREGFLRSGVDAIAEAAGVTKRTLYNHFPSKDALIAAVIENQAGLAEAEIARWRETGGGDAPGLVAFLFEGLRRWAAQPGWRGSGFTRAAMELAWAPGHPARRAAAAHKRAVERRLTEALTECGVAPAPEVARALALLIEGAQAMRLIHGSDAYIDAAETSALRLVAAEDGPAK